MSIKQVNKSQKEIAEALKSVHPDNPLAFAMTQRYRELEQLKSSL